MKRTFLEYSYPTSPNAEEHGFKHTGCYHYNGKFFASVACAIQSAIADKVELYEFDVKGNHKLLTA